MKLSFFKKALIVALPIMLLQGCFAESEVKGPVGDYLNKKYGVTDFKIISAAQGWFESSSYDVDVEIQKPYKTITHLSLFETKEIDEDSSSDVFADIMKGAYIKQFPEVISFADSLIKKYKFLEQNPNVENEKAKSFHYYLKMNLEDKQESKLLKDFKREQTLNMKQIIPTLKPSKSPIDDKKIGVVNFVYYYNTYKKSGDVPKAKALFEDFKKSRLLTEGIYQVDVQMIEVTDDGSTSWKLDDLHSSVLFQVDASGQYTLLTP